MANDELGVLVVAHVWMVYLSYVVLANVVVWLVVKSIHSSTGELKPTDFVIINLSVADCMISLMLLLSLIVTGGGTRETSTAFCGIQAFFSAMFGACGTMAVLVLGLVRYRIMTQTSSKRPLSLRRTMVIISICWAIALTYPLFFIFSPDLYEPMASEIYCYHAVGRRTPFIAFLSLFAVAVCTIPAMCVLLFYARAFRNVEAMEREVKSKPQASTVVGRLGVSVVTIYFVTVLPWTGATFYAVVAGERVAPLTDAILSTFFVFNWGINPMLYFIFQRPYRRVLVKWVCPSSTLWAPPSTSTKEKSGSPTMSGIGNDAGATFQNGAFPSRLNTAGSNGSVLDRDSTNISPVESPRYAVSVGTTTTADVDEDRPPINVNFASPATPLSNSNGDARDSNSIRLKKQERRASSLYVQNSNSNSNLAQPNTSVSASTHQNQDLASQIELGMTLAAGSRVHTQEESRTGRFSTEESTPRAGSGTAENV